MAQWLGSNQVLVTSAPIVFLKAIHALLPSPASSSGVSAVSSRVTWPDIPVLPETSEWRPDLWCAQGTPQKTHCFFWVIPTVTNFVVTVSDIIRRSKYGMYFLTFYSGILYWYSILPFYPAFIRPFFLASILAFFWCSILAFYPATHSIWHSFWPSFPYLFWNSFWYGHCHPSTASARVLLRSGTCGSGGRRG